MKLSCVTVSEKVRRRRLALRSRVKLSRTGSVVSLIKAEAILAFPLLTALTSFPLTSLMVNAATVSQVFGTSVARSPILFNLFWSSEERLTVTAYPIVELVKEPFVRV